VQRVPPSDLSTHTPQERTAEVRARVIAARERQRARYAHTAGTQPLAALTNATAPVRLIAPAARLEPEARALLVRAADKLALSARAYHRVLRVARTIADLDDIDVVSRLHVGEALRYRPVVDEASSADLPSA